MKKYVELYLHIGGSNDNIKTEMEIVDEMRAKNKCTHEYD
jgi:hypothetical protein